MGNLRSVSKALEHVAPGDEVLVTSDPQAIRGAERVVVPGQGAMPDCMRQLAASGAREAVVEAARQQAFPRDLHRPADAVRARRRGRYAGARAAARAGAEVFGRSVDAGLKIPHMGWNEVFQERPHALWSGIADRSRFYFVHSYYPQPAERALTAGDLPTTARALPAPWRGITSSPCSSIRKRARAAACSCCPTSSNGGRSRPGVTPQTAVRSTPC